MPKQIHEDFGEKIGGAKKDLWSVRGLYTDDLDEMNEREAEKYVKKDEKIGGAKKDLWSVRGLYTDDLDEMNEREAEKYVKKDNIWKKPDYQAMLDIKKVRDAVPATPRYYRVYDPEDKYYQQKQYITTIRQLQEVMEKVRNVEDAKAAFADFYVENGYLRPVQDWNGRTAYERTRDYTHNPALTENLRYTIRITSSAQFEHDFARGAKDAQFLVPKEQKIPRGYNIRQYDGNGYSRNGDWKPDTYYVTHGHYILETNFETRDEALRWVQEYAKSRTKSGISETVRRSPDSTTLTPSDFAAANLATG